MPHRGRGGQWERASAIGHVPYVDSETIKEQLKEWDYVIQPGEAPELPDTLVVDYTEHVKSATLPSMMLAIDGSNWEIPVREDFPATRISAVGVAAVMIDLGTFLEQGNERFVNPQAISESISSDILTRYLPSSNVVEQQSGTSDTVADSWRRIIFEDWSNRRILQAEECPTMLELYWDLSNRAGRISDEGTIEIARCPTKDCDERKIGIPVGGCTCEGCGTNLFPTDALRIWEGVSNEGRNDGPTNNYRSVVEQLVLISVLHTLNLRNKQLLSKWCFVMDGPLAIFDRPAWLKSGISNYIDELNESLNEEGYETPLIIGIEKSGIFNQHFDYIHEQVPEGHLLCPTNEYVYRHIKMAGRLSGGVYGENTYYAHKFCYKSATGYRFTFSIPPFIDPSNEDRDLPDSYPNMARACRLLDEIGTLMYPNATIATVIAHNAAAIPLRAGAKVMIKLTQELLGSGN